MSATTFDKSDRHEWYEVQWYDHCSKAWVFSWSGPSLERARGHIRFHTGSVDTWRIVHNITEIVPNQEPRLFAPEAMEEKGAQ